VARESACGEAAWAGVPTLIAMSARRSPPAQPHALHDYAFIADGERGARVGGGVFAGRRGGLFARWSGAAGAGAAARAVPRAR